MKMPVVVNDLLAQITEAAKDPYDVDLGSIVEKAEEVKRFYEPLQPGYYRSNSGGFWYIVKTSDAFVAI